MVLSNTMVQLKIILQGKNKMKKILLMSMSVFLGVSMGVKAQQPPVDLGLLFETLSNIKQDENDPNKIIISNPKGNEKASITFDGKNMITKDENTGKVLSKVQKNADGSVDVYKNTADGYLDMNIDADGNRTGLGSASIIEGNYKRKFKFNGNNLEVLIHDKKTNTLAYRMITKEDYGYLYDGNGKLIAEGANEDDEPKVYDKAAYERYEKIIDEIDGEEEED